MSATPGSAAKLNTVLGVSSIFSLTSAEVNDAAQMAKVLPKGIFVQFPDGKITITDGVTPLSGLHARIDQPLTVAEKAALEKTFSGVGGIYAPTEGGLLVLGENGRMDSDQLPADVWNPVTGKMMLSALPDSVRAGISVVSDYAALNAATDEQKRGLIMVVDASGDESVEKGAALYQWLTDKNAFLKISEVESLDIDIMALRPNYQNIQAAGAVMYDHALMMDPPSLTDVLALMEASMANPGQPIETASYMSMLGAGGQFIFRIENESQVVAYWNTNGGADATYIEGGKAAFKLVLGPSADGMKYFYANGVGSISGDAIAWTEVPMGSGGTSGGGAERKTIAENLYLTKNSPRTLVFTASALGLKIYLPDPATIAQDGVPFRFINNGPNAVQVLDFEGHTFSATMGNIEQDTVTDFVLTDKEKNSWVVTDLGNSAVGGRIGNTGFSLNTNVATVFKSTGTAFVNIVPISSTQCVILYADEGNGGSGTAQVLTIDGTTITAGAPLVFRNMAVTFIRACKIKDGRIVVAFTDQGSLLPAAAVSWSGVSVLLSISGTTLKVDGTKTFSAGYSSQLSMIQISDNAVLIAYRNGTNSELGAAQILSISGNTITTGAVATFSTVRVAFTDMVLLPSGKVMLTYRDDSSPYYGYVCMLTISGTTITAGSSKLFNASASSYMRIAMLTASTGIMVFRNGVDGNVSQGTACIFTINDKGDVAFSQQTQFTNLYTSTAFSIAVLSQTAVAVVYQEYPIPAGIARILQIDGTSILVGEELRFYANGATNPSGVPGPIPSWPMSENQILVAYHDDTQGRYGTAQVLTRS